MKKIILTGGGTAGHVTPHLAMLPVLRAGGFEVHYIGSHAGIERGLIEDAGLPYYPIASGKLRRYFDLKNVTDLFRVVKGVRDARRVLRSVKPDLVFSKGGFVSVPVLIAARMLRIPTVIHESDLTPGLANRIAAPFAKKICVAFPETLEMVSRKKGVLTGIPIRKELPEGNRAKGMKICGFHEGAGNPVLLITGGSQGAAAINTCVRESLPELAKQFRIIHLCGRGNIDSTLQLPHYTQFEYVTDDLPHLYAAADIVLSRAGAGTLFELLAMKKPHLIVPLPLASSRGDQIMNANSFARQGFSEVLLEEELTPARLLTELDALYRNRQGYTNRMAGHKTANGVNAVMAVIVGL